MKVLKFGGSSVAEAARIKRVFSIVEGRLADGPLVVVVSAFGGVTDDLLRCCSLASKGDAGYRLELDLIAGRCLQMVRDLLPVNAQSRMLAQVKMMLNDLEDVLKGAFLVREASPKTKDLILSFGERISAFTIGHSFRELGLPSEFLDARDLICSDDRHGKALVDFNISNARIRERLGDLQGLVVVPGFIAATLSGETTTLGRGGSDYTAAIFAGALNAAELEIWTDVNGMMTADPRRVPNAMTIPAITYNEAMELSHFGAKVIYPPTIQPVRSLGIPISVRNTFDPQGAFTLIAQDDSSDAWPVKGMTSMSGIALMSLSGPGMVGVSGVSMRLFGALAAKEISIILITQASSEHSITFAILEEGVAVARAAVEEAFAWEISTGKLNPLIVETELSIVALVGEGMKHRVGLSGQMFGACGANGVNIHAIAQGSSERIVSAVIQSSDVTKALNVLHEAFFEADTHKAHLFVVGVGTVGKVLLEQIAAQQEFLLEEYGIELRIAALANSRKMCFDLGGIPLDGWQQSLEGGEPMEIGTFLARMKGANLHNSIFLDNTASADIAGLYEEVLAANISVVTPNKVAASSSYERYLALKQTAKRYGAKYLFETNVGAGLPVIGTLSDLVRSGDRIHRIDAVLSGTLNFIFNHFQKGVAFHEVVRRAQAEGYTEPDPRIDLSGVDVMRKILILARESGRKMELDEIALQSFLPPACRDTADIPAFYEALEAAGAHFDGLLAEADAKGERLKFVATLEGDKAHVGLRSFKQGHPFYELHGKDNIVLFQTDRYRDQPLVVKGAGAGAAVTAMGLFADIIRVVNV